MFLCGGCKIHGDDNLCFHKCIIYDKFKKVKIYWATLAVDPECYQHLCSHQRDKFRL